MVDSGTTSCGRPRNMEPPVNLCVSCKGETQSFLVSDCEKTTWADVEAMVLVSFDLGDIQIKYIDEENEQVSVNSQDEYEEALKIAVKQGGILQMIVYDKNQPSQTTQSVKTSVPGTATAVWAGRRSLGEYTLVPRSAEPERQSEETSTVIMEQSTATVDVGPSQFPPEWFIRYMDRFKEQIIHETVVKVTEVMKDRPSQSLDWMSDSSSSSAPEPEQTSSLGSLYDWLLACSNCKKRILGIRYQCSTCPSFSICEPCEAGGCDHDPNHLFLKMRRPLEPSAEEPHPPLTFCMDHVKLQKQMHKTFLKAEKQRLRAEKRQRKAEMKELEKQLKLHRSVHRWHSLDSPNPPAEDSPNNPLVIPMEPCPQFIPTLSAVFVDENLPDGTHLQPGTRFIKHWRMRNTGNVKWNMDTKLNFMWGNLTLASSSRKDAPVPSLLPGQVGVLSVEFVAPALEGTYTSHWRLAHKCEQFGPRIWCSITVDSLPCTDNLDDLEKEISSIKISRPKDQEEEEYSAPQITGCPDNESLTTTSSHLSSTHGDREIYIPSVDLLTAQDLLSFELLDINIVQELERVPHNTPVDMTPCMSPLPHDGPLIEKPGLGQIKEESDGAVKKSKEDVEGSTTQEEAEEDISGTQFVCETVMRSLTLDAAPDYNPPQRKNSPPSSKQSSPQSSFSYSKKSDEDIIQKSFSVVCRQVSQQSTDTDAQNLNKTTNTAMTDIKPDDLYEVEPQIPEENHRDEVASQASCDSCEDYIIILPECFDTSKPLGESMYSSALSESQGDEEKDTEFTVDEETSEECVPAQAHTINDILTTSQTLDTVLLTPEVLTPSPQLRSSQNAAAVYSVVEDVRFEDMTASISEPANTVQYTTVARVQPSEDFSAPRVCFDQTRQITRGSIAGGLVKGALSVAASAYKALFVGQQENHMPPCSEDQAEAMMAVLLEMGFCNRQLNQRLLRKHNCNLMDVVTELIQINDNDWYSARY
ncbi:PREDICTED: next to BRCA1 gene 1 protein [Nanorana parkeri]|uniref:next to BRCA1 gene 1 protein n=1 Tax=Nanorana parkeri TaxID=125878 RepID=UPI000854D2D9|nr:PREDICTED: next to BRCA1 gene 1 protein [Nanorana parkeri]